MVKAQRNLSGSMLAVLLAVMLVYLFANQHCQAVNRQPITSTQQNLISVQNPTGTKPVPPAVFLDTAVSRQTGQTITVKGGANAAQNLQKALDAAKPGDTLLLDAGAEFTSNFVLPKKGSDNSGWVIIRTSTSDSQLPPSGTRISPSNSSKLAKLSTPNADPVVKTAPGANHYRFIGIEFTLSPTTTMTYDLVQFGGSEQSSLADMPHDLVIDRCYIHGNATANLRRGVALNSARTAIIDSHISECHERGADSQAVCGWNGSGPFKLVNNYLEGAGENVMFGGADPRIANLVPSDIEIRRNHIVKPLSWKKGDASYAGQPWSVKNLLELKNARRVVIEGNLLENNWVDAQNGFAVLFTVRNQEGSAPWSVVEDVQFSNNIVRHVAAAINILGRDNNNPSGQVKRMVIENNIIYDIGGKQWAGNGCFLQLTETENVAVNHNSVMQRGNLIIGYGEPNKNFIFTNNLTAHNEYGVIGDGTGTGKVTLEKYFPDVTFRKNALVGGRASLYPQDNFFPADLPEINEKNFNSSAAITFKQLGTDGKNIGCDWGKLDAALGGLQSLQSLSSTGS